MGLFGVGVLNSSFETPSSRDSRTKNLIMRAWRERWSEVQWGIHVRSIVSNNEDTAFLADCILQQALNGPGPNALVLSYLMHSFYSHISTTASVLKSISQYDGFHKPFCVSSLLAILDAIKERLLVWNVDTSEDCLRLATAIQSTVHWLFTCMYFSLENLSDLPANEVPMDDENTKIVVRCKALLNYYFSSEYIASLLKVAAMEDTDTYSSINKMCTEVARFTDGPHGEDIKRIISMANTASVTKKQSLGPECTITLHNVNELQVIPVDGAINTIILSAALAGSSTTLPDVALDLKCAKEVQELESTRFYTEIMQSSILGLLEAIGTPHELKFIGFVFLQLPKLLTILKTGTEGSNDNIISALDSYISSESALDLVDAKLGCNTFELLLTNLHKQGLLDEVNKPVLLSKRGPSKVTSKLNPSNSMLVIKAESTLTSILKTLDGDFSKNQEAILGVLCEMLGNRFELILTAASMTATLQQVTSRLVRLNQYSRYSEGDMGGSNTTRSLIFDVSFLMLCRTLQLYGLNAIDFEEPECFFTEWYHSSMVEDGITKDPDRMISRCDGMKVDAILAQYLQGDSDLMKDGSIVWSDFCTNAVGAMQQLLLAWENNAVSFNDVKKVMDIFRSSMCSVPVCISAWLCAHIQVAPAEQSGKARYVLDYLHKPVASEENQDQYKERAGMASAIISHMMSQSVSTAAENSTLSTETKSTSEMLRCCWDTLSSKGLLDVATVSSVKNILSVCGPRNFCSLMINELFQQQYLLDLTQWCNVAYGIFLMDLKSCTEVLLGCVLPNFLKLSISTQYFVDPQMTAFITLLVNTILSYFRHAKVAASQDAEDEAEPSAKRRKVLKSSKEEDSCSIFTLEGLLKDLFSELEKIVCDKAEASPQVAFIAIFLRQLSNRTSGSGLVHLCPDRLVTHLMRLAPEYLSYSFLLSLHNLADTKSRKNCARALCLLETKSR